MSKSCLLIFLLFLNQECDRPRTASDEERIEFFFNILELASKNDTDEIQELYYPSVDRQQINKEVLDLVEIISNYGLPTEESLTIDSTWVGNSIVSEIKTEYALKKKKESLKEDLTIIILITKNRPFKIIMINALEIKGPTGEPLKRRY